MTRLVTSYEYYLFLGSGLGKDESGIKDAIKVKLKHDTAGVSIVNPELYKGSVQNESVYLHILCNQSC